MSKVIYPELSYEVMAAVFEVRNTLGPGFVESACEGTLAQELALRDIPFERQKTATVRYKGESGGFL
jgi:GxxExxY protein